MLNISQNRRFFNKIRRADEITPTVPGGGRLVRLTVEVSLFGSIMARQLRLIIQPLNNGTAAVGVHAALYLGVIKQLENQPVDIAQSEVVV